MSDSILINKIEKFIQLSDSTSIDVNIIEEGVNSLKDESIWLKSLPLIGVVIGGLITYLAQKHIKDKELALIKIREKKESINKCMLALFNLRFYLKELAYLEFDSKYQYYLSLTETEESAKKALDEHYNDYKYITEYKNKIANCIAEINSNLFSHYKTVGKEMPDETKNMLNNFSNHNLNLRRYEELELDIEINTEFMRTQINSLANEYSLYIDDMINLVKAM
jgi:hypothetical protein